MDEKISKNLAANVTQLRQNQGLTQLQLAKISGATRAAIALLESGYSNPTLEVLSKVSKGLKVSIDELLSSPKTECSFVKANQIPTIERARGTQIRKLLPEKIPATDIDEIQLSSGTTMRGSPHLDGTREYFICIKGKFQVSVLGEKFELEKGDVLAFPADKSHAYKCLSAGEANGISIVLRT